MITLARPDAILFDMDGVLADVSESYREAIRLTAASFGVTVTADDIRARKARGNANDDWTVTRDLITARGVDAHIDDVIERFERLYHGDGLRTTERLTLSREILSTLASSYALAVVTGRPRADAEWFLARFGVRDAFRAVVTREDGPLKPDPFPVARACELLRASTAWMLGDTPDDIASAIGAGVVPIGVVAPGEAPESTRAMLLACGAARVFDNPMELLACLP